MPPTGGSSGAVTEKSKVWVMKRNVATSDKSLKCEYCGIWFYIECEEVTEVEYKFINNLGEQLHWFCKACYSKAVEMLKLVQRLQDKHDELESKVDQLTIKVDEISEMRGTHKEKVCQIVHEEVELREMNLEKRSQRAQMWSSEIWMK